jgi:RNA polymerase sigma-70 factor (ECF subfamily)
VTTRTLTPELAAFEAAAGLWGLWQNDGSAAAEVAQHVVEGERVDWNDLMRRHDRRVVVALLARGIPIDRAKDLAQDAWMRIIAQYEAGRLPMMRLPGLVVAQAMFLARDDRRRTHRRDRLQAPLVDAGLEAPSSASPPLESRVAAREDLRRVLEVVAQSYPSARNVFALAYGPRALSPTEIANELGLSLQRVRQITCELRKRLREELGGRDAP